MGRSSLCSNDFEVGDSDPVFTMTIYYNSTEGAYIFGENWFEYNNAYQGGAIYSTNCALTIFGYPFNHFSYNEAVISGGAIFFDVSDIAYIWVFLANITHNYAQKSGGGIAISGGLILILDCFFFWKYCI